MVATVSGLRRFRPFGGPSSRITMVNLSLDIASSTAFKASANKTNCRCNKYYACIIIRISVSKIFCKLYITRFHGLPDQYNKFMSKKTIIFIIINFTFWPLDVILNEFNYNISYIYTFSKLI